MLLRLFTLFLLTVISSSGAAGASARSDTEIKAHLQAAVQQHIDRRSVGGAILRIDLQSGEVSRLYPAQIHPMMFRLGEYYVVCGELRDRTGDFLPLDVFLSPHGPGFTVFHSEIDNRGPIEALIHRGELEAF